MEEEISFRGHKNVRARHRTTLEITKINTLTPRGDCIIGVGADKACSDLSEGLKSRIRKGHMLKITLSINDLEWSFMATGSSNLTLEDKHDIVIRKSDYICSRTLAIKSERSAIDVPIEMVNLLRDPSNKGIMIISVE